MFRKKHFGIFTVLSKRTSVSYSNDKYAHKIFTAICNYNKASNSIQSFEFWLTLHSRSSNSIIFFNWCICDISQETNSEIFQKLVSHFFVTQRGHPKSFNFNFRIKKESHASSNSAAISQFGRQNPIFIFVVAGFFRVNIYKIKGMNLCLCVFIEKKNINS